MQPRKSGTPGTLPPQSALAPLFLPSCAQKTSKDKSAERNEVVKAEDMAKKTALECEDWTDDDVLIPTIKSTRGDSEAVLYREGLDCVGV